jgi:Ca2+-binding EF-hand superfamily protein
MSQDERKRISAIFQDIDKNNDGFIGKEELIQAYKEYNPKDFNKE